MTTPEDTVTLLRTEYTALIEDAAAWRTLASSPHVAELIAEYFEWLRRAEFRDTSSAISAAVDWRAQSLHPTYAELQRRRSTYDRPARTAEQVKTETAASWATSRVEPRNYPEDPMVIEVCSGAGYCASDERGNPVRKSTGRLLPRGTRSAWLCPDHIARLQRTAA